MSEDPISQDHNGDLPPLPRGFRPSPAAQRNVGCARPFAWGCGCLGLLLIGALLVVQWQGDALLDWSVSLWERSLIAETEDQLDEGQRQRVKEAFAIFRAELGRGSVAWQEAMRINRLWTEILTSPRQGALGFVQIEPLIQALEGTDSGQQLEDREPEKQVAPSRLEHEVVA